jgi:hypothetical protein
MREKVIIATAGNVLVPAYLALCAKGYQVSRVVDEREQTETWRAVQPGREFIAEDTLSLLGLVALYEARGAGWRAEDSEIDAFLAQFP